MDIAVHINPLRSDGNDQHVPANPDFKLCGPGPTNTYLGNLARDWAKDHKFPKEKQCLIDQLPQGYRLFEKRRKNQPDHLDRYLYGHPKFQIFDSVKKFYPHFKHLLEGLEDEACQCFVCGNAIKPAHGRFRSQNYQDSLTKVYHHGKYAGKWEEEGESEWLAEREVISDWKKNITGQPAFVPRIGEIVLFRIDSNNRWRAGLVTQLPKEPVVNDDFWKEAETITGPNISRFRLETLQNPNLQIAKRLPQDCHYVPMHRTRPFHLWKEVLGDKSTEYHISIWNALTAMANFSMTDYHHVEGTWPDVTILCRGMFIGAELLISGDLIRLQLGVDDDELVPDIMVVDHFLIRYHQLKESEDGSVDGSSAGHISIAVVGKAFTVEGSGGDHMVDLTSPELERLHSKLRETMEDFEPWFCQRDGARTDGNYEAPLDAVAGRIYEEYALKYWFPELQPDDPANIEMGMIGFYEARDYSTKHYELILNTSQRLWWGNNRAHALNLNSFNGFEIEAYADRRNEMDWYHALEIHDPGYDQKQFPRGNPKNSENPNVVSSGFVPVNAPAASGWVAHEGETDSEDEANPTIGRTSSKQSGSTADTMEIEKVAYDVDNNAGTDDVIDEMIAGEGF